MANFNLTDTSWTEVENLVDGETYFLQGKLDKVGNTSTFENYISQELMFTQTDTAPTELNEGIIASGIKFTKKAGQYVYVRAVVSLTNVQIEKV